jgi:hypothetical protein
MSIKHFISLALIFLISISLSLAQVTKVNKLIGHVNGYTATIDIANDSNIEISWERFWNSNGDSIDISRMWIDTLNNSLGYIWYIFATTANEEQSTILQLEVDENGDLWE